jgi:hypothetical protein
MKLDNEIPGYYPGQMGERPGAPVEGSPVQKQIAEAVEKLSPPPLSKTGVLTPEQDTGRLKPRVPFTKRPSGQTPKNPL